jgi:ATP diphosphatase
MNRTEPEPVLAAMAKLVAIMDRLRGPDGCEWDRAQSFASIAPYTLEEAHEVADAIARNNMADLCDELGDLLLQVVFHARMAAEAGHFTLAEVLQGICAKMERRHPHIFGPEAGPKAAAEVRQSWEAIKAAERPRASVLDGVALALPALTRAEKLAARAARKGFDWPDAEGPRAKIAEELDELAAARTEAERREEAGDLLFAVANLARKLGVDPEDALRHANRKFEQRFRMIEQAPGFETLSLAEQEVLWQRAKQTPAAAEQG